MGGNLVRSDSDGPLQNDLHERLCQLYVFGSEAVGLSLSKPVAPGNGAAAYRTLRPGTAAATHRSQSHKILRRLEVIARIRKLSGIRDEAIKALGRSFVPIYDAAVSTIEEIMQGSWRPPGGIEDRAVPQYAHVALKAAVEVVGRVEGSIADKHRVDGRNQQPIIVQVLCHGDTLQDRELPSEPIEVDFVTVS